MLASNLIENYQEEKFFDTFAGRLKLSAERNIYNAIRLKYQQLSIKVSSQFKEKWSSYVNAEEVLDKIEDDIQFFILQGVSCVKEDLLSCKIFDKDEEFILDRAEKERTLNDIIEARNEFLLKIGAVYDKLEQTEAAREMRKNNRGRWTGGMISSSDKGFVDSYVDSVKFQVELEARNVIEGIGHSIFNAIGNSISENNARKEVEQICNCAENGDAIAFGMQKSVFNLHLTLLNLLNQEGIGTLPEDAEVQKSIRLLNNADNSILSADERNRLLIEAWELDPYNENFYYELY